MHKGLLQCTRGCCSVDSGEKGLMPCVKSWGKEGRASEPTKAEGGGWWVELPSMFAAWALPQALPSSLLHGLPTKLCPPLLIPPCRQCSLDVGAMQHIARAPGLEALGTYVCTGLSVEVGRQLIAAKGGSGPRLEWEVKECMGVGPGEMEELRGVCTGSSVRVI